MRMPKIGPFERYADKYEEWFERNKFVYESELRAIRKLLPEKGGSEKTNYNLNTLYIVVT